MPHGHEAVPEHYHLEDWEMEEGAWDSEFRLDPEDRMNYGGTDWARAQQPSDDEIDRILQAEQAEVQAELLAEAERIDRERAAQQARRARPHLL